MMKWDEDCKCLGKVPGTYLTGFCTFLLFASRLSYLPDNAFQFWLPRYLQNHFLYVWSILA
jgi:hypothetical protein